MEDTEVEEVEAALRSRLADHPPLQEFVRALRGDGGEGLRFLVSYEGETHEVVYARDDVGDDGLPDRVERLVLASMGDPQSEEVFQPFGELDATLRWFEEVVVVTFPTGEWSGVVATLDRDAAAPVDAALARLR